jgi:hypothetical protein
MSPQAVGNDEKGHWKKFTLGPGERLQDQKSILVGLACLSDVTALSDLKRIYPFIVLRNPGSATSGELFGSLFPSG